MSFMIKNNMQEKRKLCIKQSRIFAETPSTNTDALTAKHQLSPDGETAFNLIFHASVLVWSPPPLMHQYVSIDGSHSNQHITLSFRLSPFRRPTVPCWRDIITFMFIEASKDDLEVRRPIFPAAHLTSLALLQLQLIEQIFMDFSIFILK